MPDQEQLKKLCYNNDGSLKTRPECRAAMINHLILDELMDIDEAEDLVEGNLDAWNLWETPAAS
jgi:hypothetical protein